MKETIGWNQGHICIVIEDVMYDEPTGYKNWYPCYRMTEHKFKVKYEGLNVQKTGLSGEYLVTGKNSYDKRGFLYMCDHGRTKSIHHESFAISCPKVRKGLETQWNGYHWQKLLKKGWVSA